MSYTEDNHVFLVLYSYKTMRIQAFLTAVIQELPTALAQTMRDSARDL